MGETLALQPADINSDEGMINIRGGRRAKDRRVPLASRVLTEICKYHKTYQPGQYLFEGQNRFGNMKIKGKTMAQYLPNENDSGVKYASIM